MSLGFYIWATIMIVVVVAELSAIVDQLKRIADLWSEGDA